MDGGEEVRDPMREGRQPDSLLGRGADEAAAHDGGVFEMALGMEGRLLLRPMEVATLLGLGRSKVWSLIWAGELPVVRIGRAVRVPREALEAWVRSRTERVA